MDGETTLGELASGPPSGRTAEASMLETLADQSAGLAARGAGEATGGAAPPARRRSSRLERGESISRYVVLEQLGEGGMGVVYAAYDPDLDRKIAIKLLHGKAAGGTQDSIGRARLLREAQALAKVADPNVIAVHDVGVYEGRVFLAMEFVDGLTLREWAEAREGDEDWREVLAVYRQAGRGLAAAHAAGLVHRDFKPDNVLLGRDGRARVLDFGIARLDGQEELVRASEMTTARLSAASELGTGGGSTLGDSLTQTGAMVGTPAYMAPEQFKGGLVDARTDQFAFCVALWEALYGQRPFPGGDSASLAFNVVQGRLREPPRPSPVPAWLRRALERGLAAKGADRHPDMGALLAALEEPAPPRAGRWLGLAAGAALVGGVGLAWAFTPAAEDPVEACVARADLHESWNEEGAGALVEAFEATGLGFASAAAQVVRRDLDAYAEQWHRLWRDSCEATHARHDRSVELLELQLACLERRRDAVLALVRVLSDNADEDVVAASADAVAALPDLQACADARQLLSDVEPPSPEQAQSVSELRRQLDDVRALRDAGRVDEAVDRGERLLGKARELGYSPLVAEALDELGAAVAETPGLQRARDLLADSVTLSLQLGDDDQALVASTRLIGVAGIKQSRYAEGEAWRAVAEGIVARDPDGELAIRFNQSTCAFLADRDEADRAMPYCERGVALATARYGEKHLRTTGARGAYGKALYHAGRVEEALEVFQAILEIQRELLGDRHPRLTDAMNAVGVLSHVAGREEGALEMARDTVALTRESLGAEHPLTAVYSNNLAEMELSNGNVDAAEAAAREGLRILTKLYGLDHPGIGASHSFLALVAEERGDLDTAAAHYEQSIEVFYETRGKTDAHANVIEVLRGLAVLESRRDRHGRALELIRRAWKATLELDPEHPRVSAMAADVVATYEAAGATEDEVLRAARERASQTPTTP